MPENRASDGTVEPDGLTVEDWFRQHAARGEEVADRAAVHSGADSVGVAKLFEDRAEDELEHHHTHPRP